MLTNVKFYKVTDKLVDVFTEDGWENWSRVRLVNGHVVLIKGNKLPNFMYKYILCNVFGVK